MNRIFKKVFLYAGCFLLFSYQASADNGNNRAVNKDTLQTATYQIYSGGINAVTARLALMRKEDKYAVALSAYTRGFIGWLVPWEGTFDTHGIINDRGIKQPRMHRSTTTWKEETEIKTYSYKTDGTFDTLEIRIAGKDGREVKNPDPELTSDTVDILTATLGVMEAVGEGKACQGADKIFDGKRSFDLLFNDKGSVELDQTRYNVFHGTAEECTVEVLPLEGKWYKNPRGWLSIQEQGREKGTMPSLWIARSLNDDGQGGGASLPVKMRVKTDYGTLFMHMTDYDRKILNGEDNIDVASISRQRDTAE